MTAYFKCLCKSKDRLNARKVVEMGGSIRLTKNNPEAQKEAAGYGLKLPFVVIDGEARELRLWM